MKVFKHADLQQMTKDELRDWYRSLHVLLYVSRGEGNGRPPLEAGCAGVPSVVTGGMGTAWMTPGYGWALPFDWARVPEGTAGQNGVNFYQGYWMEPDWERFKSALVEIDRDRESAARKGAAVAQYCRERTWDKTAAEILSVVEGVREMAA
jgi:glycosyltransferase involved in cell wall biosynthesis